MSLAEALISMNLAEALISIIFHRDIHFAEALIFISSIDIMTFPSLYEHANTNAYQFVSLLDCFGALGKHKATTRSTDSQ